MPGLLHTALLGFPPPKIGKVREVYDIGTELLIVATDRISAFDVVMANGIPDKGAILNQMSAFWFNALRDVCSNHVISTDDDVIAARINGVHPELKGRCTLAKKAVPLTIECVARGYITGSLYKEYRASGGKIHGLDLPEGLRDGEKLPEVIFTPATKAEHGHDENISWDEAVNRVGRSVATLAKEWTLALYQKAARHAEANGIILADTKFEFGLTDDGLILIDEVLTPDSSRFWDKSGYVVGKSLPSFDKQYVRNFLETLEWNKTPPGPKLPDDVVAGTRERYLEAFRRITGTEFVPA